jgi:hypothetical protein
VLTAEPTVVAASDSTDNAEPGATEPGATIKHSDFWRYVSEALAVVWLVTVILWWWSARPKSGPREPEPIPLHRQQAKSLKAARKAALLDDAAALRVAMLEWARLQWPDNSPRSIGEIATRVSSPLSDELIKLSGASYGPDHQAWSGAAVAKAIRSFAVLSDEPAGQTKELLPPLMPSAS